MSLVDALKGFFDHPTVVHECRNCGTNVEPGRGRCPSCGATEIASYEIDDGS